MNKSIQISEVSKNYGDTEVISSVNMTIEKGEIYGFLGPNGAGKTTIMKMILNLIKPTSGEIRVQNELIGSKSYAYLKKIGSIIETPVFYTKLTATENLELHGAYMGGVSPERIKEVLTIVGLADVGNKLVTEYSLGMRQRLGIARAILTNPAILILDEPINGLDPIGIKEIRELLLTLKNQYNMTILISSHIVSEIEWIADTIGVINHGKLLKEVKLAEIRETSSSYLVVEVSDVKKAKSLLNDELSLLDTQIVNENLLHIYGEQINQSVVNKLLILAGITVNRIEKQQNTLEEYFLTIINGGK